MSRRKVVAGNWKMNHGPRAAREFVRDLSFGSVKEGEGPEVILFPPALSFGAVREGLRDRADSLPRVGLGIQNIHWEASGAFTGELSASMAAEAGAGYVLVGHSERRHLFGETDEEVARKVKAVVGAGLTPVVCVGETLEERGAGRVEEVIVGQLDAIRDALPSAESGETAGFLLAYEPVWAIGTGENATPEDASAAHHTLRDRLRGGFGSETARSVRILYGGSVKPDNARELMEAGDVDGVLVGGASLDPGSFAEIAASV